MITARTHPGARLEAGHGDQHLGPGFSMPRWTRIASYGAMDWLLERQGRIERSLAMRHLEEGTLVLRDLDLGMDGGQSLPSGQEGSFPGWEEEHLADHVRTVVEPLRVSRVGGGVRRRHGGSGDVGFPGLRHSVSGSLFRRWFWWETAEC